MNQLPKILRDVPAIARMLEVQSRASEALNRAEDELAAADAAAKACAPAVAFDEDAAAIRLASAKATDAAYATRTEVPRVSKEIEAERAACAEAAAAAEKAAAAAKKRLEAAQLARDGAWNVWAGLNGQLFVLVRETAEQLLPELTDQAVSQARDLFEAVRVIVDVARAYDPGSTVPAAYVEIAKPYLQGSVVGLTAMGARYGSARTNHSIVFQD